MIESIVAIFILAAVIEGIIAYVIPSNNAEMPREWIKYVSAVLSIAICIAYKADILATLGVLSPLPYVGEIITGLIVGRGSNFLNDFYGKIKNPMPAVVIEK